MRIISLGGVAAAALAAGLPMIPAEAQTSVIPAGYSAPAQVSRPQPVHADPAMSLSAGPLAPNIAGFNVRKPQILVYEHTPAGWQLGALEWVFTEMPKTTPLPNATFGSFPAACHFADGTFIPDQNQATCPTRAPQTGAKFTFWHPDLITMHVWVWYPNPAGLFSSTNPLVAPFNRG